MTPADRIRARLDEKRKEYADYQRHHGVRTAQEDLHGMWDCAINMAEVSAAIDALEFALEAMGEKEPPLCHCNGVPHQHDPLAEKAAARLSCSDVIQSVHGLVTCNLTRGHQGRHEGVIGQTETFRWTR